MEKTTLTERDVDEISYSAAGLSALLKHIKDLHSNNTASVTATPPTLSGDYSKGMWTNAMYRAHDTFDAEDGELFPPLHDKGIATDHK